MFEDISKVVLVSDMDGTLLNSEKNISETDRKALDRFMSLGGKFTVATGRTIQSFEQYNSIIDLRLPVIMYNGAAIYDCNEKKICYTHPLPETAKAIASEIIAFMPDPGGEVLRTDGTYVFSNNDYQKLHTKLCNIVPNYAKLDDIPKGGWLKILFSMAPEDIPHLEIFVRQKGFKDVDFVKSSEIFYEMLPKGITKGSAIEQYRKLPGMEDCIFVAIGDFDNDLEMLQSADFGACPSNSQESVRRTADLVLKNSNDTGAVAELIDYIIKKCGEDQ